MFLIISTNNFYQDKYILINFNHRKSENRGTFAEKNCSEIKKKKVKKKNDEKGIQQITKTLKDIKEMKKKKKKNRGIETISVVDAASIFFLCGTHTHTHTHK